MSAIIKNFKFNRGVPRILVIYLAFTCEKVNKAHVRRFSHLNCKRKTCGTECVDIKLTAQFHSSLQLRQHGHGKKRVKIKIPPLNSNECNKRHKPMSDPLQPSINHASYGGTFDVSSESTEEWHRQMDAAATSAEGRRPPLNIPPDFRVWETVGNSWECRQGPSVKFKVLSYNVLAQYLLECHPYLYTDCSPRDLKWKARAARLYDEITKLAPDILCFQEVQASHVESFYSQFERIGYFGVFKQKTGHRQDGCAIYFKQSKFELKDHLSVEFYQPELPILNRDNIGIIVKLLPHELPGSPVVVATTHLLYNPKRTDVRLAQMQVFLAEIDRFAYYDNGRESGHHPIIMTGDLNSTPDSAVIKLLDRGHVSASPYRDNSDWRRIGVTDNCQHLSVILNRQQGIDTKFSNIKIYNSEYTVAEAESCGYSALTEQFSSMFNSSVIGHSLNLGSVYSSFKSDGQCVATTFQDYWVTVDYIYFSCCSALKVVERLRLPTETECEVLGRLPNEVYGSDHLALAAVFELKPYKSTL
ncbi:protein angel homolog 1 isoform X4 [Helicoverpa armigera]|nr:protein angel homolog 1 isoform X4 [Helicoverpa armigera]